MRGVKLSQKNILMLIEWNLTKPRTRWKIKRAENIIFASWVVFSSFSYSGGLRMARISQKGSKVHKPTAEDNVKAVDDVFKFYHILFYNSHAKSSIIQVLFLSNPIIANYSTFAKSES